MNSNTSEPKRAETERNGRGVLCAKCEHLNAWARNRCVICSSELFMDCSRCGERNERVRSHCRKCHERLRHPPLELLRRRIPPAILQLDKGKVFLFCIGVAVAFAIIFLFAHFPMPETF